MRDGAAHKGLEVEKIIEVIERASACEYYCLLSECKRKGIDDNYGFVLSIRIN